MNTPTPNRMSSQDTNQPDPTQTPRAATTTSTMNTSLQTPLNQQPLMQGQNQEQPVRQIPIVQEVDGHDQPQTNYVAQQLQIKRENETSPQQVHDHVQRIVQSIVNTPSEAMARTALPIAQATSFSLVQLADVTAIKESVEQEVEDKRKKKHAEEQKGYRERKKCINETLTTQVRNMQKILADKTAELDERRKRDVETDAMLKSLRAQVIERWPDQTMTGSKSGSTITHTEEKNEVQKLFEGPPLDPARANKGSPDEPILWERNMTLGHQMLRSIHYYVQQEDQSTDHQYWTAKHRGQINSPSRPLQSISGGRWDFILGVQLADGTYFFGYLLHKYTQ